MKASYDECWRTVEQHGSDRMRGRFVHPFDDDDFISGNGTIGLEILEDLPDVDAIVAPLGGGGLLTGIGVAAKSIRPEHADLRGGTGNGRAAFGLASAGQGQPLRGLAAVVCRWRRRKIGVAGMWPLLPTWVDESIVVTLDDAARAMRSVADRVHVIAEGRRGLRGCGGVVATRCAARGHRKIVAVVSGGNIDLARFAS